MRCNRKTNGEVKGDPTRAVAYLRVSTEEQTLGPDAQRAAIERWADAHGVTIVATHADLGISGGATIDDRPELLGAIDDVGNHGAGLLIVAKRDRLARDTVIAAMVERLVERAGAKIVSADGAGNGEGPEALLMRRMIDAFAEYERALIRSRTRAALAAKRAQGFRLGQAPYGFRLASDGRTLMPEEREQKVIARARELRGAGMKLESIAEQLSAEGAPCRRGKRWHVSGVHGLLAREGA
jgi:DNA invertase Pin-like site-specific DNA recombinase